MLTPLQKIRNQEIVGEKLQAEINLVVNLRSLVPNETFDQMVEHAIQLARFAAMAAHSELPQYNGKWDDWELVIVSQDVVTKRGTAFLAGDFAIGKQEGIKELQATCGRGVWSLYSIRNGCDTAVGPTYVEQI